MKNVFSVIRLLTAIPLLLLFSSFAMANDPIETGTFNNKAIYGYDTVAYFTDGKAIKGKDNISSEWNGAVWQFSSSTHKTMFDAEPEKFAPQYGGHCAYAMSKGRFVGVDEEAFTIHNDKLYLNYSKGVREDWLKDKDGFIELADVEYPANID